MTLEQAQQRVDDWITTIGVRYFGENTNMAILTEEVGELARIMADATANNPKESTKGSIWERDGRRAVGLTLLANQTGVDLSEASNATERPNATPIATKTTRSCNEYLPLPAPCRLDARLHL